MTLKMKIIDHSKTIKKIPCLFGRHKQAEKPLRLAPNEYKELGAELFFCERCFKILQIGHFPPFHPNCLCTSEYWEPIQ